jgi:hypothetical protein
MAITKLYAEYPEYFVFEYGSDFENRSVRGHAVMFFFSLTSGAKSK